MCFEVKESENMVAVELKSPLIVLKRCFIEHNKEEGKLKLRSEFTAYTYAIHNMETGDTEITKNDHIDIKFNTTEVDEYCYGKIDKGYHSWIINNTDMYDVINIDDALTPMHNGKVAVNVLFTIPKGAKVYLNIHSGDIVSSDIELWAIAGSYKFGEDILCVRTIDIGSFFRLTERYITTGKATFPPF